ALRSIKRERQARLALEAANAGLEQRVRDRTDALEQANQRLTTALAETESARSEAELANQAKSRFLAAASHDLRQPLQALHLFLDALSFRLTEPKNCQLVGKAIQALEGGESLLNALLDISTLEAGTVEPEVRDFRVWVLLDQLTQEFDSQALKKGLVLHMVPSSLMIRSDPVLLARIVRNLMSNALRHSRRGRILLGVRRIAGGARIEVWDTGPGIPPDKLQVIFEDFYQLDNPERDRTKGLGIGLSIVERTAHLLGHGVAVRSILGKGSMFAITVPLAAEEDDADMAPMVPALQEG
ncbi:MAG: HAMP domain-containing histidine kinase, partial [Rhodospirillales bacterium]|nr:HAMP domain-containing histidine kinase [Rhodospirillales bacterium]